MSQFTAYFAVLLACVAFVNAEGPNVDAVVGAIMKTLQEHSPAVTCPQTCAESCALESAVCIDIPEILDCAAESAACTAACAALCGCLADCGTTCPMADCMAKEGIEMATCLVKGELCLGQCEVKCPVAQLTQAADAGMKKASATITHLVGQLTTMLGGLTGMTGGGAAP